MIKTILVDALNKIKAEEMQAIANAVADNKSKVVSPKFVELDAATNKAIAEVQNDANTKIADLKKQASDYKAKFENDQRVSTTEEVENRYLSQISQLQNQIDALAE